MQIGNFLAYAGNPREAADKVVQLERAGLDIVWVAEAYGFDSPTLMGYLAARTERVAIGSGIMNLYSRTPSAIAQTVAGLDNVSQGRAVLGLGASGPQVIEGFHGVTYAKPLTRTREVIDVVRMALRREPLIYDGETVTLPLPPGRGTGLGKPLKLINAPERAHVPIWVAALGPQNVALTAEVADGWLPHLFLPEQAQDVWGDALAEGKSRRDPALGELGIAVNCMLAVAEGVEADRLRDLVRPMVALYVGGMGARNKNFYNDLFVRYGFEEEAKRIQDLYLDRKKDEAAAAVPADVLRRMNLVGSPGEIQERIAVLRDAGVTMLNVEPVAEDPVKLLEQLREWAA